MLPPAGCSRMTSQPEPELDIPGRRDFTDRFVQDDHRPIIRDAIHAVLPGLDFTLSPPSHGADRTVWFASPYARYAAMEKQTA
uniref:Uncharacterized protein n=1 Tax=Leersia perrieri TaxID=77586 RepID=A0A0D9V8T8_9ORYZ